MIINNNKINIDDLFIVDMRANISSSKLFEANTGISADFVIFPSIYQSQDEEYIATSIDVNAVDDLVEQLSYCCENDDEIYYLDNYISEYIADLKKEYKKNKRIQLLESKCS